MNTNDIREKAIAIIEKEELSFDHLLTCYKAELCPECGSPLHFDKRDEYVEERELFGLLKHTVRHKVRKISCPNGHTLVNPYNRSDSLTNPGSIVFRDAIGPIGQSHRSDYGAGFLGI